MKKLLLVSFAWCCAYLCSFAQTNCNPDFTYRIDGFKVIFEAIDSIGASHTWDFGDGAPIVQTTNRKVSHVYQKPGTYTVKHVLSRPGTTCQQSATKTIQIRDSCNSKFYYYQVSPTPANSPFTYQFKNASQSFSAIQEFNWKFGDGSFSNVENPVHAFAAPGNYEVCLRIKTASGCISNYCALVTVVDSNCVVVKWKHEKDSANALRIKFINETVVPATAAGAQYKWTFGDGAGSTDRNAVHTYAQPGNYNVCLRVYVGSTCVQELCKIITVGNPCALDVKWRHEKDPANPLVIKFINETVVPFTGAKYKWSFGDGQFSDDRNVTHKYDSAGTYLVCLKVIVSNTCVKELCKQIVVGNPCYLIARFDYKIDSVQKNKVYFINRTQPVTNTVHYKWKFGDGTTSADANPVHVYQQPGIYDVCLVAETTNGCRSEYCAKVEIRFITCNIEPKFTWQADNANPNKIYFKNLTVSPTAAIKYTWKFGDGTTSTDVNPVHVYQKPGEYEVCLVAELSNGCRKIACQKIIINTCDVRAKFEWKHDASDRQKIWFTNLSQPVSRIWRTYWSYGDGTSSQDFNSMHTYAKAGKYYVCLKVVSLNGCISSYCDSVIVGATAACNDIRLKFEYKRDPDRPNKISFVAVSNQPIAKQKWTIKRDSTIGGSPYVVVLNDNNPTYVFPFAGWYNVCLTATMSNGCVKEYCERIYVAQVVPGVVSFRPVSVFPNPANATVKLEFKLDNAAVINVSVMDAGGSKKLQLVVSGQTGNNIITIPVQKLSQGQYLVELRYANQVQIARFQKI